MGVRVRLLGEVALPGVAGGLVRSNAVIVDAVSRVGKVENVL